MNSAATPDRPPVDAQRAWEEYQRAARQLDAVRRSAASTAERQTLPIHAAHEELASVRARLMPQRTRLILLGVSEAALRPSPPEVAAAARGIAPGPEGMLAAVRQIRAMTDAADVVLAAPVRRSYRSLLPQLLVFGPLVILVLLICAGLAAVWIIR